MPVRSMLDDSSPRGLTCKLLLAAFSHRLIQRIAASGPFQFNSLPPRSASTRCSVAPPSSPYSSALLSSLLKPLSQHKLSLSPSFPRKPSNFPFLVFSNSHTKVAIREEGVFAATYICFPPKISRCCAGGMPSFSSTRSFILETL